MPLRRSALPSPNDAGSFLRRLILAFAAALLSSTAFAADAAATRRLHAFFDAEWQWPMRTYLEWVTFVGDHRRGARLRDASPFGVAAEFAPARHGVVLDQGSVPLPVLERAVDEWIGAGGGATTRPNAAVLSPTGDPK